ncbi:MAG: GNAT family N-acetyltransferase [Rhodanobacteraceae bacterium]
MKQADDQLATARLALRRFTPDDMDVVVRLHADARAMRHIGGPKSRDETAELFETRILGYYDAHPGLGVWATIERSSAACIGLHLLNHIRGESIIQVGYVLFPQYWGAGYATEMSVAILHYGFVELGLPQIAGITDLDHVASQRVLLKSGLRRNGERSFAHPAYASHGPLAWFERDVAGWIAEHGGGRERAG